MTTNIPKHWQIKKLGEICTVIAGQSPSGQFYNKNAEGMPFYQGKKDFDEKFINLPTTWTTKITKVAEPDDILMSVRAPVGPTNFATDKICIGRGLAAIRTKSEVDKDFLFYFFRRFRDEIVGNTGAVFGSISKSQIESIEILLPPIHEQKRLVTVLDKLSEKLEKAKENAEKNIVNAKKLLESYIESAFDNLSKKSNESKLGEKATFRNGINFTNCSKGELVKIVGVKDFQQSFYIPLENLAMITADGKLNDLDVLREDDILVVRSNGNPELIGRCILARHISDKITHSGFTIRIRLNSEEISSSYLCHYLKSKIAKKHLIESGTGVNIKSLNQQALASLIIPIPSLGEQQKIVSTLDELYRNIKKLEIIYSEKLAQLEDLKKSILNQAFTGRL